MIVYAIASTISKVYGHGDRGEELVIPQIGSYGTLGFAPVFGTRQKAQEHMDENMKSYYYHNPQIVELEVIGD